MGLRSIKEIFITGHGPSSSHTMGPYFASRRIVHKYKDEGFFKIGIGCGGSIAVLAGEVKRAPKLLQELFPKIFNQCQILIIQILIIIIQIIHQKALKKKIIIIIK